MLLRPCEALSFADYLRLRFCFKFSVWLIMITHQAIFQHTDTVYKDICMLVSNQHTQIQVFHVLWDSYPHNRNLSPFSDETD